MIRTTPMIANRGAGLIEIMVTVFVLAIGLLGIAALQIQSKRANFEALQRTTATMLTQEIIERMRANARELNTYITQGATLGGETISTEPTPNCQGANQCSVTQLALHDLWEWEQAIDGVSETAGTSETGGLVSPTGCLSGPVGGGTGVYTTAIAWRSQNVLSNPAVSTCGEGSGQYDGPGGTDADKYRRVLTIDFYVDAG